MVEGTQIGAYRVLKQIGEGGMGAVWLAEHVMLGRRAALKVLHSEYSSKQEIVGRFFNEARAATAISDPGIVQVFDFGYHTDGSAYIVMELLDGEPLDKRLARVGTLPPADVLRVMRQVASALGAAHAQGIVHRDLKPENIFLVRDPEVPGGERAKILDFGIAKLSGESKGIKTHTAALMGTPLYMSPEQCRGAGRVDARADIYSLGCVLFALVVGRPPFEAEGMGEVISMHLREPAPLASSRASGVPPALDRLIARCLAKDPNERPASGKELAAALGELHGLGATPSFGGVPSGVLPVSTTLGSATSEVGPRAPKRGRGRVVWIGAILGVALVAGGVVMATQGGSKPSAGGVASAPASTAPASTALASTAPASSAAASSELTEAPEVPDAAAVTKARIGEMLTGFAAWARSHAGAACPGAIDLDPKDNGIDGWGTAFAVTCTDQPRDQIVGIVSAGPDGKKNTADDVASWTLGADLTSLVRGERWQSRSPVAPVASSRTTDGRRPPIKLTSSAADDIPTERN
jgi:serine/threonine-protein kinase